MRREVVGRVLSEENLRGHPSLIWQIDGAESTDGNAYGEAEEETDDGGAAGDHYALPSAHRADDHNSISEEGSDAGGGESGTNQPPLPDPGQSPGERHATDRPAPAMRGTAASRPARRPEWPQE